MVCGSWSQSSFYWFLWLIKLSSLLNREHCVMEGSLLWSNSVASHQGKSQFVAEIATISAVQHRNLVKLYGCCYEGAKKLLVYEYLESRSLNKALFGMWMACQYYVFLGSPSIIVYENYYSDFYMTFVKQEKEVWTLTGRCVIIYG